MRTQYRWLEDVLTKEECERIIEVGSKQLQEGGFFKDPKSWRRFLPSWLTRKSKVSWIEKGSELDPLMERLVNALIYEAREQYGVHINFVEQIQFTEYSGFGHYRKHIDSAQDGEAATRLISASVELSDPQSYKGGDLQIEVLKKNCKPPQNRGWMTIFPSVFWHKVTPVWSGCRHSLVLWGHGVQPKES